jgi:hypothetical protein
MKRIVLAAAIAGLAATAVPGIASAKDTATTTSLSARHYWHHSHYRGWRSHYAGCRVVVRSHINRWGHRVFVRRRICY